MKRPIFVTAEEAAAMIKSGSNIATIGMTLVSASESILKALEQRFLETGEPNNLTLMHSCGQSDRDRGIQHFAHEGMLGRIIGGHWGLQPKIMDLIARNKVLAYNFPQGRVTDHRAGVTVYKLEAFMDGDLDEILDALALKERTALLAGEQED